MKLHLTPIDRKTGERVDPAIKNTFVDEGERVIVYDDLGGELVHNGNFTYTEVAEQGKQFLEQFDVLMDRKYLANPKEDFYQGVQVMRVIRRKSDGEHFGYAYLDYAWNSGDREELTASGEEEGFDYDYEDFDWDAEERYYPEPFAFKRVVPHNIPTFVFPEVLED